MIDLSPLTLTVLALFVGSTIGLFIAAAMSSTTVRRADERARRLELACARAYGFLVGMADTLDDASPPGVDGGRQARQAADELGDALGERRPMLIDAIREDHSDG